MITLIAAVSLNGAIGRGGVMPWHISADMRFFKRKTMGHTVIMGRRTWESIGSKPLPGRNNVIISRTMPEACSSLEEALGKKSADGEIFIIGGGEIYRQAISLADRLCITRILKDVEDADTFFPEIDPSQWSSFMESAVYTDAKSGLEYQFVTYLRKH
ncbi:MAG: dihydrofolate reductase [Bacteroidales bacterium]|nr:dihydrofolate reductase [Bacteroidales bacterium]